MLLGHLGVQPSSSSPWPLSLPPRTLAVLAHHPGQRQQTLVGGGAGTWHDGGAESVAEVPVCTEGVGAEDGLTARGRRYELNY